MNRILSAFLTCLILTTGTIAAQEARFLYLSDQRIITVETADSTSIILNYINLSDSFEILQANQVVLLDQAGTAFRGHLFRLEDSSDPARQFELTNLVKPGQFLGYVIAGKFDASAKFERALVKISGRILELEALTKREFELIAARIGELDLAMRDRKMAIERAGFFRGYGQLKFSGSAEAAELEGFFPDEKVIPPVAIATPAPRLPSAYQELKDPVVVRVKATVTRSGGLRDVGLLEGIGEKLDQIAVQTVQNSWIFLPAVSDNELAEAELKLNVVFQR